MRAVVQRVSESRIIVEEKIVAETGAGLLVLLGVEEADGEEDVEWLAQKIAQLRIFNDEKGIMNRSLLETGGDIVIVSQFTLHASTKKGNRPSYIRAARTETAIPLYRKFIASFESLLNRPVGSGIFGAHMQVSLVNDGPVTIIIDSKNRDL